MKKLLLAGVALLIAAPAIAADYRPVFYNYNRPAMVVAAPAYSWTGFYVGLNAGFVGKSGETGTSAAVVTAPSVAANALNLAASATNQFDNRLGGFLGGGQVGYNYQLSPIFVAGIEADIQGSTLRGDPGGLSIVGSTSSGPFWTTTTAGSSRLDYLGTLRGRVGVTATPAVLLYATGGLAYGRAQSSTLINFNNSDAVIPGSTFGSISSTLTGWTAGAGLEWILLSNLSAKAEYLYYDLGSLTYPTGGYSVRITGTGATSFGGTGIASVVTSTTDQFRGNIVRFGLNYKFGYAAAPAVYK